MNNLQEVVRYVRSGLDQHCVFVHMTAPQLETMLAGLEELKRENAAMKETLTNILLVTADGSLPDEWNGSTGGSGHAECRRLSKRVLAALAKGEPA